MPSDARSEVRGEGPLRPDRSPAELRYRLDADGRVVWTDASWSRFARENGAPELAENPPGGFSLWAAISDPGTREIYRRMLAHVRGSEAPFAFGLRCDAPDRRRFLRITVRAGEAGTTEFRSCILREEPRPSVALLEEGAPRTDRLLKLCGWCGRIEVEPDRWEEVEVAVVELRLFEEEALPSVSHGICDGCAETMLEAMAG